MKKQVFGKTVDHSNNAALPHLFFVSLFIAIETMPAAAIATATKPKEDAKVSIRVIPSKMVSAPVSTSATAGALASGVPSSTPSKPPVGCHGGDAEARLEEQIWTGLSSKKKKA